MAIFEDEEWRPSSVGGYIVSNEGRVFDLIQDKHVSVSLNNHGVARVNLLMDGKRNQKTLAGLVAEAFVEQPYPMFDTVINLDGNRANCSADNLAWRPRWFAMRYHRQFGAIHPVYYAGPIRETTTGTVYNNVYDVCVEHGLLFNDVVNNMHDVSPDRFSGTESVFPHRFEFEYLGGPAQL